MFCLVMVMTLLLRVFLFCSLGVLSLQEFLRDPPPMQTQTMKPKKYKNTKLTTTSSIQASAFLAKIISGATHSPTKIPESLSWLNHRATEMRMDMNPVNQQYFDNRLFFLNIIRSLHNNLLLCDVQWLLRHPYDHGGT